MQLTLVLNSDNCDLPLFDSAILHAQHAASFVMKECSEENVYTSGKGPAELLEDRTIALIALQAPLPNFKSLEHPRLRTIPPARPRS
eukprot:gene21225-1181_t